MKWSVRSDMSILYIFIFLQLIEVLAAVAQVAHGTIGVELVEQVEVNVGYENHLGVGRSLRSLAVVGESEVARREHGTLSILYVHVVHTGQVAHTARNGHIALVLDGTGLGAYTHTGVSVLGIGHEGHEEYLHAVLSHEA